MTVACPKIQFFVPGEPRPGGSKTAFVPRGKDGQPFRRPGGSIIVNMTDAGGAATKHWRTVVSDYAMRAMLGQPIFEGPLQLEIEFVLARPKAHFGTKSGQPYMKDAAPFYSIAKPDCLKFARSTEDALTGICFRDDAQNAVLKLSKRYTMDGKTGALITITAMTPTTTH